MDEIGNKYERKVNAFFLEEISNRIFIDTAEKLQNKGDGSPSADIRNLYPILYQCGTGINDGEKLYCTLFSHEGGGFFNCYLSRLSRDCIAIRSPHQGLYAFLDRYGDAIGEDARCLFPARIIRDWFFFHCKYLVFSNDKVKEIEKVLNRNTTNGFWDFSCLDRYPLEDGSLIVLGKNGHSRVYSPKAENLIKYLSVAGTKIDV